MGSSLGGRVERLGREAEGEAMAFLLRSPETNLPLLSAWESGKGEFLGARGEDQKLRGMLLLQERGTLAMASQLDRPSAEALGSVLGRLSTVETLLAEREAAGALWKAMEVGSKPRLVFDQALLRITANEMGPYTCPTLRRAEMEDLPQVQAIAKAMFEEEIGLPPASEILDAHIVEEVEAGSIWVLEEEGALAFAVQVATRSSAGVELQRVFTVPSFRRRGLATLAIGQLCRTLLGSLPRVTLRVHESNDAALGLYRKLGFESCARMRLICL